MSSAELSREEVVTRYNAIETTHFENRKEAHLENLRDEETETEEVTSEYTNKLNASKQRDEILKTLISTFLPNGRISDRTGWEFKAVLPLAEMEEESPDLIVGKSQTGGVLLVNILPERERPNTTICRLIEAAEHVRNNRHTFSQEVGMDINEDDIRCALCVSEKADRRAENALEEIRADSGLRFPIEILRVDGPNSERVDLYTTVETTPDGGQSLEGVLREGIEVAKDMHAIPDFFPESHHQLIAEHTVGKMVQRRLKDDAAKTHFLSTEFESYIRETLSYSNAGEIADERSANLLNLWNDMGLIEELSPSQTDLGENGECFRFDVDSRGAGNVMKEVKSKYQDLAIDHLLEVEAMRLVLNEFDEQQTSIADWGE